MLRIAFVLVGVLIGLRYAVKSPFHALLFYVALAYFRPDAWVWSDAISRLNLSFLAGLWLVVFTLASGTPLRLGWGPVVLLVFVLQSLLSALVSPAPDTAWAVWTLFARTLVVSYLFVVLITDQRKLRLVLLVMALGLGAEAAKQGWAQMILNPGAMNVNHIASIGDNNHVAVGMAMLLALLVSLSRTASGRLERWGLGFVAVGIVYRGISTYSRGGFLAFATLGAHFIARARRKLKSLLIAVGVVALIVPILPDAFWDRMNTMNQAYEGTPEMDLSMAGRLHFWRVGVLMGDDRPLVGVGPGAFANLYDHYDPSFGAYGGGRAVHSIWFGFLGEVGYLGLVIAVVAVIMAFWSCRRAYRLAKRRAEYQELGTCASALEGGLLAFVVGGSFISFQFAEIAWHFIALAMTVGKLVSEAERLPVPVKAASAAQRPQPLEEMAVAGGRR